MRKTFSSIVRFLSAALVWLLFIANLKMSDYNVGTAITLLILNVLITFITWPLSLFIAGAVEYTIEVLRGHKAKKRESEARMDLITELVPYVCRCVCMGILLVMQFYRNIRG